ncbi:hypothetical protein M747DRAFT_338926 [Aspergillus niger ATCC 13496]|uniref:Rhodopsin domain-containing protein n=1 Tax=Aspergillus niger ATCC 13496 TaxID=1353008 RepID=A0A370C865_ASPNG|nr:hypothetical protein ANI_1_3138024 [Aspergillus niger CBS 513.88]RDH23231.1 hypothetical protein M747DRAFT_338926 [Aspergillus niger ATCC 13496]|eukprot:XP_003188621.1 hypothetical protein ANI_1_3138024 [Aspergillus niger CBS 513.88]
MYALPVGIVFLCLATVTVALRLYTRLKLVRKPGWDDLLIVLSLATDVVFFAFLVIEIQNGLAENEADLAPEVVRRQLKALWITIPLYNLTLTLTKLSLIFLYRRLFPTHTYRILLILTLIFVIITGLWMVLSTLIFCIPINAFWDTSIPHTCLPEDVVWCLNAAFQITTDLILVVLPLPILANLNLPKRQKAALLVIFALGFFVCATSIVRLSTIVHLLRDPDFTSGNGLAATWSFVESNVAIICACLPPLRPLLVRIFPKLIPSRMRSYQRDKDSRSNSNPNNNKAAEAAAGQPPPTISKSRTRKSLSKRGSRNEPEHIDFDFLSVYGAGGNMFAPGSTVSTSVWGDAGSVRSGVENGNKDGDGNGGGEGDSGGEGIQIMREVRWDSVSVSGSAEGASHGTGGWGNVEGRLSEGTRRSSGAPFLHPQWVGGNGFEW